jgi:hypothetical protein
MYDDTTRRDLRIYQTCADFTVTTVTPSQIAMGCGATRDGSARSTVTAASHTVTLVACALALLCSGPAGLALAATLPPPRRNTADLSEYAIIVRPKPPAIRIPEPEIGAQYSHYPQNPQTRPQVNRRELLGTVLLWLFAALCLAFVIAVFQMGGAI